MAAFFVRATGSGELAADLTAEGFAQALASVERFDPALGTAAAWLFGIARNVLAQGPTRKTTRNTRTSLALSAGTVATNPVSLGTISPCSTREGRVRSGAVCGPERHHDARSGPPAPPRPESKALAWHVHVTDTGGIPLEVPLAALRTFPACLWVGWT